MKKHFLSIPICLLLTMLIACGPTEKPTEAPTEPTKSQEELHQMYEQATEYEQNGKFKSAIELFRTIYSYGGQDEGHSNLDREKSMRLREEDYLIQKTLSPYVSRVISYLRDRLRDPNSLEIYKILCRNSEKGKLAFQIDYGARNGFGGMVRDTYSTQIMFFDSDAKVIESLQEWEIGTSTVEEHASWLIELKCVFWEGQIAAFVNGTVEY